MWPNPIPAARYGWKRTGSPARQDEALWVWDPAGSWIRSWVLLMDFPTEDAHSPPVATQVRDGISWGAHHCHSPKIASCILLKTEAGAADVAYVLRMKILGSSSGSYARQPPTSLFQM